MLEGKIIEFHKWNRALTKKERDNAEKYLMRKHGKLKWFWSLFENYGVNPLPEQND